MAGEDDMVIADGIGKKIAGLRFVGKMMLRPLLP